MTTLSTISISASRGRFDAFAGQLAEEMEADLVLSSSGYPAETTSVIGIYPVAELLLKAETTPVDIKAFCFSTPGLTMGFVSYTYGMMIRGIVSEKPLGFSMGHLKKYAATAEFDSSSKQVTITSGDLSLVDKLTDRLGALSDTTVETEPFALSSSLPKASLNQTQYEAGVSETLERILSGYTYQLNLSTKFTWDYPNLDSLALFLALYKSHPAPFYAWFNSGFNRVLSTSPERFLRVRDGYVLSQPIKGTLRFDEFSPDLVCQLVDSPKEDAELSMIVDLVRNDISSNCEYGSVRVENHKSVFVVDSLLQMYANVHGKLQVGRDCLDLFFDAFPGGSVTGCPKQSSMTIIEELEPHSRGVYCGSVVVVRDKKNMDSSILIRTAVHNTETNQLDYWAGSGIVVDSSPASEYLETLAKAEKFLKLGE